MEEQDKLSGIWINDEEMLIVTDYEYVKLIVADFARYGLETCFKQMTNQELAHQLKNFLWDRQSRFVWYKMGLEINAKG